MRAVRRSGRAQQGSHRGPRACAMTEGMGKAAASAQGAGRRAAHVGAMVGRLDQESDGRVTGWSSGAGACGARAGGSGCAAAQMLAARRHPPLFALPEIMSFGEARREAVAFSPECSWNAARFAGRLVGSGSGWSVCLRVFGDCPFGAALTRSASIGILLADWPWRSLPPRYERPKISRLPGRSQARSGGARSKSSRPLWPK